MRCELTQDRQQSPRNPHRPESLQQHISRPPTADHTSERRNPIHPSANRRSAQGHQQERGRGRGPVADLHHELDVFYASEADRVNQLKEKWTGCSMEEWSAAGDGPSFFLLIIAEIVLRSGGTDDVLTWPNATHRAHYTIRGAHKLCASFSFPHIAPRV